MPLTYAFTCPTCGERTLVDEPVRELLLETGCAVCGDPLDEGSFEAVSDTEA